ncbi:reticulon-4-interacting protein 1 homolog, mitochondrial [Procambarus clarkii]|uniref:reticulon-4-interacting protein 1 homolog, mitochondrial n=1 Tax=Procambarus clarkii TaxID=6728 RepID=UPI003743C4A3
MIGVLCQVKKVQPMGRHAVAAGRRSTPNVFRKSLHKTPCSVRGLSVSCHKAMPFTEADSASGPRMKAWQTSRYDGVDGLSLCSVRTPAVLDPGDLLVRVHAASVNPIDTKIIKGYGDKVLNMMRAMDRVKQGTFKEEERKFPLTGGRDFAGEVVCVGQNVKGVVAGDQVLGVVSPQHQGSHAEYVVTAACNVCLKPENVSTEEAASIPYAGLTAWSAVTLTGMVTATTAPQSRILIIGASGGVGIFLCQLLSSWGAEVVGLCSSDAQGMVASFGVETMDYRDAATKSMLIADGGFDVVINASGVEDLDYMKALKPWKGASYVTLTSPLLRNIDDLGMMVGLVKSTKDLLWRNVTSLSEGRTYKWSFYTPNPCALKQITEMLASQKIRPVVDKVFPFTETPEAYSYVINGHARGKTVISMSQ